MIHAVAGVHARLLVLAGRIRRDERGQGTVEYVGLAMAVGVLLLAVSSFLGGQDHGLGSIITGAIKSAVQRAAGGGK
jgi:Flp pilus assembly pilin Flp